jgi:DNA-binding IclR family transcriptional regulator
LETPSLGVTEISQQLNLNKSNVYDILTTFKAMRYLEQDETTNKYHLSLKLLDYSHAISSNMMFRRNVLPHMQEIASITGETVFMGICDRYDVVYLDGAFPPAQQNYRTMFGFRAPLYCTGLGKAILRTMEDDQWKQYVPPIMERFTENTICSMELLEKDLKEIRKRGYSIDNMEHEYGIKCVAMPILNSESRPRGGISISGPSLRFTPERIELFVSILKDKCAILRNLY